jgi:DNA-binding beta-propeller fold protein YncE
MSHRTGRGARYRAALCLALAICGLCTAAEVSVAATTHPFLGALTGESIALHEEFRGACGVAVDAAGDVYVADYFHDRVLVFNEEREFLTQITGLNPLDSGGVAPIDGPCDLAVDSNGYLYVNNYHRDVVRLKPATYPPQVGTAYGPAEPIADAEPTGVAVDPVSGDVYVDERSSIALFTAPVEVGDDPSLRIGEGSLQDGYGVAVSSFSGTLGRVYVADAAADVVKVYDPVSDPFDPVEVISGEATPRAAFSSLVDADLAVDPGDGHLYVVDNLRPGFVAPEAIVHEFSPGGHYRGQAPTPQIEGEASFLRHGEPSGLAIGPDSRIYVTSGNGEDAAVFIFGPAPLVDTQLLRVDKTGAGLGSVATSPAGLRCGSACTGEFEQNSKATLFAKPERGSRFAGWSGCEQQQAATSCTMTMAGDRVVGAEFEPAPQVTLTVTASGSGTGTVLSAPSGIQCGSSCADEFDQGSSVILTATPSAGNRFAGWSGCDLQSLDGSCRVTISSARTVAAEFEALPDEEESGSARPPVRTPVPTVAAPAPPPAGKLLRILGVRTKGGVASLRLAVPAAGMVSASGKAVRPRRLVALRSGEVDLRMKLTPTAMRALRGGSRKKLAAEITVAFAPFAPTATQRLNRTVTFRRQGPGA